MVCFRFALAAGHRNTELLQGNSTRHDQRETKQTYLPELGHVAHALRRHRGGVGSFDRPSPVCMYARDNVHQEGPSTLHVPRARASKPARPSPHIVVPVVGARKSSTQPNHGYWRCACFDVSCTAAVLRAHAVRGYKDVEISGMTCGVLRVDVETAEALASVFSADEQTRHQKRVDFSLLEPRSPVPGRRRTQVGGAGGGKHLLVKVHTF